MAKAQEGTSHRDAGPEWSEGLPRWTASIQRQDATQGQKLLMAGGCELWLLVDW